MMTAVVSLPPSVPWAGVLEQGLLQVSLTAQQPEEKGYLRLGRQGLGSYSGRLCSCVEAGRGAGMGHAGERSPSEHRLSPQGWHCSQNPGPAPTSDS